MDFAVDDYNEEDEETEGEYDGEEVNDVGIEEKSEELACPFCSEDFDVLGLCCHIDADHRMEVKPGVIRGLSPFFFPLIYVSFMVEYVLIWRSLLGVVMMIIIIIIMVRPW